jgi:hypothetical protein
MQKIAGPASRVPLEAATVMADGGRFQRDKKNGDAKTHWHEYKAGLCLELGPRADDRPRGPDQPDPAPAVPSFLLNLEQVETLTREIGQKAACVTESEAGDDSIDLNQIETLSDLEAVLSASSAADRSSSARELPLSPQVEKRDVVASTRNSAAFGPLLAGTAWSQGLFQAQWKGFVGDGQNWIWSIWDRYFKAFDFIPILDVIHAVTYVYGSAMAGQSSRAGWDAYRQWIGWIWSGEVSKVIRALADRQDELGLPTEQDGETSPRRIVSDALTYLQNQQSRMDYPRYRKLGLPISSSHMESTVKELNYRIKGSEKFWGASGGEAVLQLKADTLSDSDPLSAFWDRRSTTRTGFHTCTKSAAS